MAKPKIECEHCGAKIVEYRLNLSHNCVSALAKMFDVHGRERCSPGSSGLLTHNQLSNFQKLRHWGFLERADETESETCKRGWWRVTQTGRDFLAGACSAQETVVTYRGKATRFEGAFVKVTDALPGYQYRGEYAAGARIPPDERQGEFQLTGAR